MATKAKTKKAAVKKVSTKKAATNKNTKKAVRPVKAVPKAKPEEGKAKTPGLIAQIITLHKEGYSNKEIIEKGFSKVSTNVYVAKHKKNGWLPKRMVSL